MLEIIAFLCGTAVMALEITGSRIMAPYLGTSVLVWTALIGVIMAFLSMGYWLGGKLADRSPSALKLAGIILCAAFSVLCLGYFHRGLLATVAQSGFQAEMAAIVAATILFSPASLLLGMVSPYLVRVALQTRNTPIEKTGAVIGRFSAVSAIGSILGTFLGGYFFISWIGSRMTVYTIASVLMSVAFIALVSGKVKFAGHRLAFAAPFVGLALTAVAVHQETQLEDMRQKMGFVEIDTRYNHLLVYTQPSADPRDHARTMRYLSTPPDLTQSAMYVDKPCELALDYTKRFALAWQLQPRSKDFLMLGGAGYSIPKYLLATRRDITLDVVEIDPGMTRTARDYFELKDDRRMTIHHEDARFFLNRNAMNPDGKKYDIIMADTFSSVFNIPFQMSTVECAERMKASLKPDGLVVFNIIASLAGERGQMYQALRATFEQVFPSVHIFPGQPQSPTDSIQNIILVASPQPGRMPTAAELEQAGLNANITPEHAFAAREELTTAMTMLQNEWRIRVASDLPPLTDDLAPVERYAIPLQSSRLGKR